MTLMTRGSLSYSDDTAQNANVLEPATSGATGRKRRRPRILVVDDEKLIAVTMAEILEGAGFQVATAYDGWTALEQAGTFHPDYLLSDILMPRMNGVDLAIAVRQMYPAARILLFSGQAGITGLLRTAQDRGFQFDLIAKPIHPLSLIERLKGL
jgi:CheY-like chemotaxis protein